MQQGKRQRTEVPREAEQFADGTKKLNINIIEIKRIF